MAAFSPFTLWVWSKGKNDTIIHAINLIKNEITKSFIFKCVNVKSIKI